MGTAHFFLTDRGAALCRSLESEHYIGEQTHGWTVYSKRLSGAVVKHYSFWNKVGADHTTRVRVTYELVQMGKPLSRLAHQLKQLNHHYLRALPGWKTKRPVTDAVRGKRLAAVRRFLNEHDELIRCFRYEPDELVTEGNHSFNWEIASTPRELAVCFQFVKALLSARAPYGIVRGRREVDRPSLQRNGWIKRYAASCKKRGWQAGEIAREIQKELRDGTWNERSRLQYNLAGGTICKIAGMKVSHRGLN